MAAAMSATGQPNTAPPRADGRLTGQVTYLFAYDIAYDMDRRPIETLLGQQPSVFRVMADRRVPVGAFFYRPQMVSLPPERRELAGAAVEVARTVKVFPVGAVSIAFHVPFAVRSLEELAAYRDPASDSGSLGAEARALAEEVERQLEPLLIGPAEAPGGEEAYTVFCLDAAPLRQADAAFIADAWLHARDRDVAALLLDEQAELLSGPEVADTIHHALTYYRHDLAVMDWDAAVIVDDRPNFEQVLHVMELANVQLAELRAYDRILDEALERSYRDLRPRSRRLMRTGTTVARLRELALDMSRLSDELSNAAKFFGDWHLARIYQRLSVLFHLPEWQRVIDRKLAALDKLYHTLRQDQTNRWMMILEVTIVALFVLDVVLILLDVLK